TIVGDILLLVGIVSVVVGMNRKLSLVTFSILPLLFYVAWAFRRRMRQSFREVRSRLGRLNSFLAECIGGMHIIQVFNRQKDEEVRFSVLNASYRDANTPVIFWDSSLYAIVEALSSVAVALLIWYGGGEIIRGALTFGVLVAFIQYIEKFFTPIRDLSAKYSVMQGAMAALERIFALLDTQAGGPIHHGESGGVIADADSTPRQPVPPEVRMATAPLIELRDISFAYREGENALENFSLSVRQGERVALVGE